MPTAAILWRRSASRALALLLLSLISADAMFDTSCDPIVALAQETTMQARSAAAAEQCGALCVPDCFCCSRTLVASTAELAPALGLMTMTLPPVVRDAPDGVRPVPYHPPLSVA